MSEEAAPERIAVIWAPEARADLRGHRARSRNADSVLCGSLLGQPDRRREKLKPPLTASGLRCTDYRVFFDHKDESTNRSHGRSQPP